MNGAPVPLPGALASTSRERQRASRVAVTTSPPSGVPATVHGSPARVARVALWYAVGTFATMVMPSAWRYGAAPWALPIQVELQFWVWGAAFAAFALAITFVARRPTGVRPTDWITAALLAWGAGALFLVLHPDLAFSRAAAAISVAIGVAVVALPRVRRGRSYLVAAVLLLIAAAIAAKREQTLPASPVPGAAGTRRLPTALTALSVTTFPNMVDSAEAVGGALEPLGDAFILMTGEGEFSRLQWDSAGTELGSERLPLTVPLERAAFFTQRRGTLPTLRLRATDFVLDTATSPVTVYASHTHWDPVHECITLRISVTTLPESTTPAPAAWRTLFESVPCLPLTQEFDEAETGGRLAWIGARSLLLTVGDHGQNGLAGAAAVAQDRASSYGKILRVELDGSHAIHSLGHRNPQGLEIDRDGRIWSTEHGPQGGDELNLIARGANFGWPLVTYGTQYGLESWPLSTGARDHGDFQEPVRSWIPALGISSLIQVSGKQFPGWDGDLLVGSLRARTLIRIRTRGDRVVSEEPIALGRRIRDLAEGSDGRIVIWNGVRDVIVLVCAQVDEGERAYAACAQCHGRDLGGTPAGPSLRRVLDRRIASMANFEYSPALHALGGAWTDARLDAFVADPDATAPGTAMDSQGVPDAAVRRALIAYLRRNY